MKKAARKNFAGHKVQYIHLQHIPLDVGLKAILDHWQDPEKQTRVQVGDYMVHVTSLRLRTFLKRGAFCYICGLKATGFSIDTGRTQPDGTPHMNMWGMGKDGKQMLFTHDHVIDRARGGADSLKNSRTCCTKCNGEKNDRQIKELGPAKKQREGVPA